MSEGAKRTAGRVIIFHIPTTISHIPRLTTEELIAWIRKRHVREEWSAIAESLGVESMTIWRWMNGTRQPSTTVRVLAALLAGEPRELPPGLPPARGAYKPRKRIGG